MVLKAVMPYWHQKTQSHILALFGMKTYNGTDRYTAILVLKAVIIGILAPVDIKPYIVTVRHEVIQWH